MKPTNSPNSLREYTVNQKLFTLTMQQSRGKRTGKKSMSWLLFEIGAHSYGGATDPTANGRGRGVTEVGASRGINAAPPRQTFGVALTRAVCVLCALAPFTSWLPSWEWPPSWPLASWVSWAATPSSRPWASLLAWPSWPPLSWETSWESSWRSQAS